MNEKPGSVFEIIVLWQDTNMAKKVTTLTQKGVMAPIGPYSHIAKTGDFIAISAIAGVNPATGELAGSDIEAQTRQIMESFDLLLASASSNFAHVLHINVFLTNMSDFDQMNLVYADFLGDIRPARTVISVCDVPKQGALLTMNLSAVTTV
jgi:2-iminobutanoate/2-iminopropanoate deaminase